MRKISLLIITFMFFNSLLAQNTTTPSFTLNHLSLSVKDVDKSAEFYENIFNFNEIVNRTKIEGIRWFALGDDKELHLISILKENITINKAVHFAFSTPDFDVVIMRLDKNKINYSDWPGTPGKVNIRADGIKQIFFQDPDGYWIEVNSADGTVLRN